MPVLAILFAPVSALAATVFAVSLLCLICLGALAARTGGASTLLGAVRVVFWGALAMAVTAVVGRIFGT